MAVGPYNGYVPPYPMNGVGNMDRTVGAGVNAGGGMSQSATDAALEGLESKKRADLVRNTKKSVDNANTSGIKQAISDLR